MASLDLKGEDGVMGSYSLLWAPEVLVLCLLTLGRAESEGVLCV